MRNMLRSSYSIFRPFYVPVLRFVARLLSHESVPNFVRNAAPQLPPFDAFLRRARSKARLSKFHARYPFALERGPAAVQLQTNDPYAPFGHEPELAHLIDRLVPDDGVFLDVGSNFGYFSIYLATRPNFHGSIHAFEPIARSFAGLRGLVDALQCTTVVTCHQAAASDKDGTANMEVGNDPGLSSIKDGELENGETVRTIALDSLKLARVDFMKIDVEGHEASALKGAEALIRSNKPFIFLESWAFPAQPDKVFEALQILLDHGYDLFLPAWAQSNGTFLVGIGAGFEMDTFALVPFSLTDRTTFPSNPINIFACPRSREASVGERWSHLGQVKRTESVGDRNRRQVAVQETLSQISERLQAQQNKIKAVNAALQAEQDKIRTVNAQLQAEQDKIRATNARLQAEQNQLKARP